MIDKSLSRDAVIFGFSHLRSPQSTLAFGGDGAEMEITPRARAALSELISAGYAAQAPADTSIPGREYYQGTMKEPSLGRLAQGLGINPFAIEDDFVPFQRKSPVEPTIEAADPSP